jgi:hypothetical protein
MASLIKVVAGMEGMDRDSYEELAAEQAELGSWTLGDSMAKCYMGEMTIEKLAELFDSWGDELNMDELEELGQLEVGSEMEIERGRGLWYEVFGIA